MSEVKRTRSELKREAILNAAKKAFIKDGVQSTSMDKVSELAQVSKRTVYNHFETKEILVMQIMAEMWRKSTIQPDFEYLTETSLHEQLSAILLAEAKMFSAKENLDLSRVAFGHFFYNPEALQKEMGKFSARETTLFKWLEAAVADNRLKPMDFEFANSQLHNMIKGHCFWPLLLNIGSKIELEKLKNITDETAAMFLSHYARN
ncbi:TetR/AcrR family transcriptional regulator [Vibrio sp. DW001]|uniref:TetR/AcrR family transcriptional regulator n=1 Tax=Vibrio sp. DW001 TaxID=2912315 RepID=UPI0023B1EE7B|nr:TetR/AcrR family transcriptional regulator [Vibrio sp. DW001]WED27790.1 TetR/AcrR family transcriptional regulator [Vibrio sp. DW001]